jgi:hypothetical protein
MKISEITFNQQLDEGLINWVRDDWGARSNLFRGKQAKNQKAAYDQAETNFVAKLTNAINQAVKSGLVTTGTTAPNNVKSSVTQPHPADDNTNVQLGQNESKNLDLKLKKLFNESILTEAKSVADFVYDFIKASGSGYNFSGYEDELRKLSTDFQDRYVKNRNKVPQDIAQQIFGALYSIGANQERSADGSLKSDENFNINNMEEWLIKIAKGLRGRGDERSIETMIAGLLQLARKEGKLDMNTVSRQSLDLATKQAKEKEQKKPNLNNPTQATAESRKLRKKSV